MIVINFIILFWPSRNAARGAFRSDSDALEGRTLVGSRLLHRRLTIWLQDFLLHDPLPGTLECVSKHVGSEPRDAPHVVSRVSLGLCFGPMVQYAGAGPREAPRRDTNSNFSWVKRQRWCRETGLGGPNVTVRVVRLRLLVGSLALRDVSISGYSLQSSVDTSVLRAQFLVDLLLHDSSFSKSLSTRAPPLHRTISSSSVFRPLFRSEASVRRPCSYSHPRGPVIEWAVSRLWIK